MNRATLIFLGAFLALAFSWTGLVLSNQVGYGALAPHFDDTENKAFPGQLPGLAARGALVYQDLGCAYCHTQQVRGGEPSSDLARKWGDRPSYARDYIRETGVFLGDNRVGPDLRNVGSRAADAVEFSSRFGKHTTAAAELYFHLFSPQSNYGSTMPAYDFLFELRKITGQPSENVFGRNVIFAPGTEIVPTERAKALVAYLLNLKNPFDYPDEKQKNSPPPPPKKKGEEKSAPAAKPGAPAATKPTDAKPAASAAPTK